VVAKQLFTSVKRGNAIAKQQKKTAHRITVSRFFFKASPDPSEGGEEEKKELKRNINYKKCYS
jgi:hypothetical protein